MPSDENFELKWNIKLPSYIPLSKEELETMQRLGTKIIGQLGGEDWHIVVHALLSVLQNTCDYVNEEIEKKK